MSFVHGNLTVVVIDDINFSPYLNQSTWESDGDVEDVTPFGAPGMAHVFVRALNQGKISVAGWYDPTLILAPTPDIKLAALRTQDGVASPAFISIAPNGTAVGSVVKSAQIFETQYKVNSQATKVTTISAAFTDHGPLTDALSLVPITAPITSTGNGASVDNTTSSLTGAIATLHVTTITGTTPTATFKVQHSTDNVTFVDLSPTFTALTTVTGSQRITIAGTINRYVRGAWTIGGTTPSYTAFLHIDRT